LRECQVCSPLTQPSFLQHGISDKAAAGLDNAKAKAKELDEKHQISRKASGVLASAMTAAGEKPAHASKDKMQDGPRSDKTASC
jgi:hypothetical protein